MGQYLWEVGIVLCLLFQEGKYLYFRKTLLSDSLSASAEADERFPENGRFVAVFPVKNGTVQLALRTDTFRAYERAHISCHDIRYLHCFSYEQGFSCRRLEYGCKAI